MLLPIGDVLDADSLSEARRLLGTVAWRDGKETAGRVAKEVKINTQADLTSRTGAKLRDMLRKAVINHPVVRAAAWPKRMSKILVSKTGPGGGYGLHVDNAFMGSGEARVRTDLSFTLFL
ncbi:MAG: PKHD-type hydroxylase, partial [Pseudomonadota bacterium]